MLCRLTRCGTKYLRPAKCWYFDLRDDSGTVRRVKGFADLKATEQLAAEMERKAARRRAGIIDPAEEHARRPLAGHLADYAVYLDSKGNTPRHTRETVSRVSALLTGCGFVFPPDLEAGKVSAWLADPPPAATPPTGTQQGEGEKPKPADADADTPQYVTLDQMAALVNRSKKTLERAMNAANSDMPKPDVEGGGGRPHEWRWNRIRPWLETKYARLLPKQFPTA